MSKLLKRAEQELAKLRDMKEKSLHTSLRASELRILPFKVEALAVVETDQEQGTRKSSENVATSTLVESAKTFLLHDLGEALPRAVDDECILSRSHHRWYQKDRKPDQQ